MNSNPLRLDYVMGLEIAMPVVVDLRRHDITLAEFMRPRALREDVSRLLVGQLLLVRAAEGSVWMEVVGKDGDGYLTLAQIPRPAENLPAGEGAERKGRRKAAPSDTNLSHEEFE